MPLVAVSMSAGAAFVGSAFSPINPFQVGIAQKLAQLPLLSGGGFRSVFLYKNEEKPNTTFVEDLLQERYHDLGLPRRLHRRFKP